MDTTELIKTVSHRGAHTVDAYEDSAEEVGHPEGQPIVETYPQLEQMIAAAIQDFIKQSTPTGDDFIILQGGLIANTPSLEYFDLDALESDNADTDAAVADVRALLEQMEAHPNQRGMAPWIADVTKWLEDWSPAL